MRRLRIRMRLDCNKISFHAVATVPRSKVTTRLWISTYDKVVWGLLTLTRENLIYVSLLYMQIDMMHSSSMKVVRVTEPEFLNCSEAQIVHIRWICFFV